MKYNMQNGFLNWGELELEMECNDLTWKKVLTQFSDSLLPVFWIEFTTQHSANTKQPSTLGLSKTFELWALWEIGQCNIWAYYGQLSMVFKC